jgi:hypothetical protein
MTPVGVVLCVGLPLLLCAVAVITHLVQCHTERVRHTHFSAPMDYERYHYSRLQDFIKEQSHV